MGTTSGVYYEPYCDPFVMEHAVLAVGYDTDENGNRRQYAIKRIFPTINAAFILVEMLILKLVDGQQHNADLIQGFRLDG